MGEPDQGAGSSGQRSKQAHLGGAGSMFLALGPLSRTWIKHNENSEKASKSRPPLR